MMTKREHVQNIKDDFYLFKFSRTQDYTLRSARSWALIFPEAFANLLTQYGIAIYGQNQSCRALQRLSIGICFIHIRQLVIEI